VTSSVVARGSGSPELGVPAAPGVKSTRAWVGRDPRDTRELPRAKARHGRGSSDEHDGGGGSARRRNDGARVPGARKGPELRHLAHTLRGFDAMLTRGLRRPELRRKEDDNDDRRRRRSGFVGVAAAEGLRAPVQRKPTRGGPVKGMERSARPERHWWLAIARRRLTGGDGSGPNSASARARGKLGWAEASEGEREEAVAAKKGGNWLPRRADRPATDAALPTGRCGSA
jgi:hypothetical protein